MDGGCWTGWVAVGGSAAGRGAATAGRCPGASTGRFWVGRCCGCVEVGGGGALIVGGWVWIGTGWVTIRRCGCSEKSRSCGLFSTAGGAGLGAGAAVVAFCANAEGAKTANSAAPHSKLTPYVFIASRDPLRAY